MSMEGHSNEPGRHDPGLEHLVKALTADGDASELAGRDAAAAMFNAAFGAPSARRPRLSLKPLRAGVAAAVIAAVAATTAAAYAAVLPAPVQRIAHSVFAPLGVPDRRPPASGALRGQTSDGPSAAASSASARGLPPPVRARPHPSATPRQAPAESSLALTAVSASVPAGGDALLEGEITGTARPGIPVRLFQRAADQPGWRLAGSAVTGSGGRATFTVPDLAGNATFYLAAADHAPSSPVTVTVIPYVALQATSGLPGTYLLRASARFGDPGDAMTLQELSGGAWTTVASQALDTVHQATFTVRAGKEFRALLEATGRHAAGVSDAISLPPGLGIVPR
jgi:hypothetical protein